MFDCTPPQLCLECQTHCEPVLADELSKDVTATPNTRRAILQAGTASIGQDCSQPHFLVLLLMWPF